MNGVATNVHHDSLATSSPVENDSPLLPEGLWIETFIMNPKNFETKRNDCQNFLLLQRPIFKSPFSTACLTQ